MSYLLTAGMVLLTLLVIFLTEKLARFVLHTFFKTVLEDIEAKEKTIAEYNELSILALACQDKEAYKGFQELTRDTYWRIFFRKIILSSSVFFLLLSPYLLFVHFVLQGWVESPFGLVIVAALLYFMSKTIFHYVKNVAASRRLALGLDTSGNDSGN